jgi:hypothetical protein
MKRYIQIKEPAYDYSEALFEKYIKEYFLLEKTFNIEKDVDFIYNKFFKKYVERFEKHNILPDIDENDPYKIDKIDKVLSQGKLHKNMAFYEVDAQIHAIKQLKRTFKKEWDNLTLLDLFYKIPSLRNIAKSLYFLGKDVYKIWMKDLVKRMNRENLLGKFMRDFPEYHMFESIDNLYVI